MYRELERISAIVGQRHEWSSCVVNLAWCVPSEKCQLARLPTISIQGEYLSFLSMFFAQDCRYAFLDVSAWLVKTDLKCLRELIPSKCNRTHRTLLGRIRQQYWLTISLYSTRYRSCFIVWLLHKKTFEHLTGGQDWHKLFENEASSRGNLFVQLIHLR